MCILPDSRQIFVIFLDIRSCSHKKREPNVRHSASINYQLKKLTMQKATTNTTTTSNTRLALERQNRGELADATRVLRRLKRKMFLKAVQDSLKPVDLGNFVLDLERDDSDCPSLDSIQPSSLRGDDSFSSISEE
jgi:hypothetical protein